jgi:hypothetical protein
MMFMGFAAIMEAATRPDVVYQIGPESKQHLTTFVIRTEAD